MSVQFKSLHNSENLKLAKKHLYKYIFELKRHFDISDFQTFNLLVNVAQDFKKNNKQKFLTLLSDFFVKK